MTETLPSWGQAFTSGLLSFISPSILALLPVALIYVTGVSLERRNAGAAGGWRLKGSLLLHLSCFLGGFLLVLMGMAAGHTWAGRMFLLGHRSLTVLGGILTAVMGIFMSGLAPRASQGDLRLRFRHRLLGYLGSAAVGGVYGLVWAPCVGPTLGSLILAAGTPETSWAGLARILVHGLGFGLPFLLLGLFVDGLLQGIRAPRLVLVLEKTAGAFLAGLGFLIAVGRFTAFTDGLFQTFDFWVRVLIEGGL